MPDVRPFFVSLFEAAVDAADPTQIIGRFLPARPKGRTIVVGAGKGSVQMAAAFEQAWSHPLEGLVVTRHGFATGCKTIEIMEAGHPVPDAAGLVASGRIFEAVANLSEDDLVIALVSGGGSALLPSPPLGMTLADEIAVNAALLASGAPISAMNTVRKHLSSIKGGRLALAAYPARVISLVVSDIPGDNPAFVASGPTVPDLTTRVDALAIIEAYNLRLPEAAVRHLNCVDADAPKPTDPRFARNEVHIVASATRSMEAAAAQARAFGVEAAILSDAIEGEARDIAGMHAAIAREIATRNRPFSKPVVLISGGETTVSIRGRGGKGGRNSEFLLALAQGIDGVEGIHAFAADTDGVDGTEDNAGAFVDYRTIARMRAAGIDPKTALGQNDSWSALAELNDLFISGPTGTNVNDLRAILIR